MQNTIQFRVQLNDIQPAIWRTFQVDATENFFDLHSVIQIVMGWENAHLFEFKAGKRRIGLLPDEEDLWEIDDTVEDCEAVTLAEFGLKEDDKLTYIYDFGDNWEHTLTVEKILPQGMSRPVCLAGERSCPPEDCGGIFGYVNMLEILRNPDHEEYEDMMDWVGEFDPELFDLHEVNELLQEYDEWRKTFVDDDEAE